MAASGDRVRVQRVLALGGTVLIGILTALQARLNGQLGLQLHDGFVAAAISFGSGFAVLVVLSALLPSGRQGVATLFGEMRARRIPPWMLAGGAAGAVTVATQGIAVGIIGVSLFSVGYAAGQSVCGLVLDRIGFGPGGAVAVTMRRVAGAALALIAVGIPLVAGAIHDVPEWMLLLPFVAGIGVAWQQATNGRLRARVGTPLTATLVNFAGGTVILVICAAVSIAVVGAPVAFPPDPLLYIGGPVSVIYIFLSAALVAYTGVLLLALGAVLGQLLSAFVLDSLWPATAAPAIGFELTMIAVALVAVLVAAAPRPRARS